MILYTFGSSIQILFIILYIYFSSVYIRISNKPFRIAKFISQLRFSTWSSHTLNILIDKMVSFNYIYYRCCNKVFLLLRVCALSQCSALTVQFIFVREGWSSKFILVTSICYTKQQLNSFIVISSLLNRIDIYFTGIDFVIRRIFTIQYSMLCAECWHCWRKKNDH